MNRSELQERLIREMVEDMDMKTMMEFVHHSLDENYDKYSDQELITEIEEYYPHILEE